MKKIKRIIFTLFIATLCLSLLPSCGKSVPGKTETPETTKGTETVTPVTTDSPATDSETEGQSGTESVDPDEDEWVTANRVIPDEIPVFDPSTVDLYSSEEAASRLFDEMGKPLTYFLKYRCIYYTCPTFLYDLVDRQEVDDWYNETVKPDIENNVEPTEMYTVQFVKHFHIAKSDFERLSVERLHDFEERAEKTGEKIDTEFHEIHNADIIYTFDNEIINNYYLRDQG